MTTFMPKTAWNAAWAKPIFFAEIALRQGSSTASRRVFHAPLTDADFSKIGGIDCAIFC